MSKTSLRSAAVGLLVATLALAPFLIFTDEAEMSEVEDHDTEEEQTDSEEADSEDTEEVSADAVAEYIEERGLVTVNETDYEDMQARSDQLTEAEQELAELREEIEAAEEAESENDETDTGETEEINNLYLVVSSGMSSGEIASILEDSGIIDDAADFRQYIDDNDLVMSVRMGEYMLDSTMSISEIAEIIT